MRAFVTMYTCCGMNVLGKGRPHPEREYLSRDQGQHAIPAPPTSVVLGTEGRRGKEPGQVGRCRRAGRGPEWEVGPEWPGRMNLFLRAPPCGDGSVHL